jgi:hypothetical protein
MRISCARQTTSSWTLAGLMIVSLAACGDAAPGGGTADASSDIDAGDAGDGDVGDGDLGDGDAEASDDAGSGQDGGSEDDSGAQPDPVPWYVSKEPLTLALSGAFGAAFQAAHAGEPDGIVPPERLKEPFAGTAAYTQREASERTESVELAVRGNSSLQECDFPKIKFAFAERVKDRADVFFGTKKVKVGTHCGDEEEVNGLIGRLRNEKAAWREEVVYQLARALGISVMHTRPAVITYTNNADPPRFDSPLTRKAFLLEHVDEMARRVGATALKDPVDCGDPAARPDAEAVLRVRFFHAMVGNWDFTLGPPESNGCGSLMNTEVLRFDDGSILLVPADFDLAAFVVGEVRNQDTNQMEPISAENALASARFYLQANLQGEDAERVDAMRAEYRAKQSALTRVIDESVMDAEGKAAGQLLIAGFFAALSEKK